MSYRLKVRKIKIFIPVLIFMGVLLGIALFIGNQLINPTFPQTTSVGERWITYSNDRIGFSFEIPAESSVNVDRYGNYFTITTTDSKIYFTIDTYQDINKDYPLADKNIKIRKPIQIAETMKGLQVIRENDMNPQFTLTTDFVSPKDNKRFTLSTEQFMKDDKIVYEKFILQQEAYNHLLSTFNCCSVSKQTYTNKYYGYSLIIPTDWKVTDGGYGKNVEINALGISGNTITLAIDNNSPYMLNDNQSIYPVESSNIEPQIKEFITLAGKDLNSLTFIRKDGSRVRIIELVLPNKHKLTIFLSSSNSEQSNLDSIENIIKTLSY